MSLTTALTLPLRRQLRRHWGTSAVVVAMVGLVGGVALFGLAGARRTASALDRFVDYNRPIHVFVSGGNGLDYEQIARLPQVERADTYAYYVMAPVDARDRPDASLAASLNPVASGAGRLGNDFERPILVEGRLPDSREPLEVTVNEALAEARRLGPGSHLRLQAYTSEQFDALFAALGALEPKGPVLDFIVVGVHRQPRDVGTRARDPEVAGRSNFDIMLAPAFHRAYVDRLLNFAASSGGNLALRLAGGPEAVPAFAAAVRRLPGGASAEIEADPESQQLVADAGRAADVEGLALAIFAVLTAATGLVAVGSVLARRAELDAADRTVLQALGMSRWQLHGVVGAWGVIVAVPGCLLAVALAVALSSLAPFGVARKAEIDPGVALDVPVLALGGAFLVTTVVALATLAGWRGVRGAAPGGGAAHRRAANMGERLSLAGVPVSVFAGAALTRSGREGDKPPIRTTVAATSLAVAAAVAALVLAASLDRLTHSPRLYGWNWDVVVGDANRDNREKGKELLPARPFVRGFTAISIPRQARVGDADVMLVGLDVLQGRVVPEVLEGRLPASSDEVVLGQATLDRVGADVGDRVSVEVEGRVHTMRITGVALLGNPGLNYSASGLSLGRGALVTMNAVEQLFGESEAAVFLVDLHPDVEGRSAFRALQADWGKTVLGPVRPLSVENLRRVSGAPVALAGLSGIIGLIALGHALVTSVRRRRRDIAVLKTLGFVRRQVAAAVAWEATLLVLVALLVGLPLGLVGGRWAWRLVADGVGTPADARIPLLVVVTVPLTVVVANVAAAIPARAAGRVHPAQVLRGE